MAVDIHLSIISKDGEYRCNEIYDGRDHEWFDNLTVNYGNEFYQNFPRRHGIPLVAPEDLKKQESEGDCYGFYHVNVGEFLEWFVEVRPDIDAGWVSTYDKWLYERKGIVPQLNCFLGEEDNPYDFHFIEVENPWDSSKWLYEFIQEREDITVDDFIVYCFDC